MPGGVGRSVVKGDKAVCVVPIKVRRDQDERDKRDDERSPPTQSLPRLGREDGVTGHAEREIDHSVFSEQAYADGEAERDGPRHALALDQLGPEIERDRPEQQKRHIGSDGGGEKGSHRQRVEHDCRPEAGARPVERPARQEHEPAGNGIEHRRKAANTGFAVTAKFRSAADDPGDQRRLGEIAEIELPRPRPILRLVKHEVGAGESIGDQPCRKQRHKKDDEPKLIGLCLRLSFV